MTQGSRSLRAVKMLRSLNTNSIARIEQMCGWQKYTANQSIISFQDTSTNVLILIEGHARIIIYSPDGKVVSFRDIGPGEMFGEFAAIDQAPRSASIEALDTCTIASIPGETFRNLLMDEPTLMMELLHHLVAEVRGLTNRVYEFSALAVRNRIQAELLRLAKENTHETGSILIRPAPTHSEIASRISTHREAVSREISRLNKMGLIERVGRDIRILDFSRLEELVHKATGED